MQSKSEIEKYIKSLESSSLEQMLNLYQQDEKEYISFALSLRQSILENILKNGDVGESTYLLLYFLYAPLQGKIPQEESLNPFIQTAKSHFLTQGLGDFENQMLLELEVLCLLLNAQCDEAIKVYIQGISHLNIHSPSSGSSAELIRTYFPKMNISMNSFLEAISGVLQKDYYCSLSLEQRRSILNWQLHCFWNVSTFFNHRSWLLMYPLWKELFYWHLQNGGVENMDHALYMQFFIYHMCGNSFSSQEQWRVFSAEIDEFASSYYASFASSEHLPSFTPRNEGKITIALLRDRIVENSPYKVEYSFLKQLLSHQEFKEKYTIKIYLMSLLEKSENSQSALESYQNLGIEICDVAPYCNQRGFYNSHLQKAMLLREMMIKDKVQILLSPNNGYGISDFLIASRVAQSQIFWSHGNFVYNVAKLDGRITHICGNETRFKREGYEFVGIPVVMDNAFYNPPISSELISLNRSKFPKDKVILGTIGRLTKIDSLPYLSMLVRIMKAFPRTIYLACGSGNTEEIKQKLKSILGAEYEEFMQRFFFCGYVNNIIFGHLIDFWPDSFPMEQGESRIEYVAKGKLSLVLLKDPSKAQKEWITMAVDEEDYYQKALHLLSLDKKQKDELMTDILGGLSRYNQKREELGVTTMMQFLHSLCKNS
ncbi:hypothetical protein CQA62_01135 [Helicobacter cholecystus]|uniref:Glycosyltransferase n=1 Tax=Helicobacter cholecystus TaxID=45498 RepID=A0A3D8IXQ6_9HELI|nr:hypothetical protein [Helicobacter cholecystus]RDU70047.1 hypothetical protein CQA62_01135 [Helicobacter cholecystus]VEJ24783.1 Uncharacterised protein [Helicobacter cholecystus]